MFKSGYCCRTDFKSLGNVKNHYSNAIDAYLYPVMFFIASLYRFGFLILASNYILDYIGRFCNRYKANSNSIQIVAEYV